MRLNLGAGGQHAEGWTSLDRAGDVDVVHDLTDLPLPFDDHSCEGVAAHHVLDLLPTAATVALLADIYRVLEPGAPLRISLADIDRGIDAAIAGDLGWFPEQRGTLEETLGWFVTQAGARRAHLTPDAAIDLLLSAGFQYARKSAFGVTREREWITDLDSRAAESCFVEAVA